MASDSKRMDSPDSRNRSGAQTSEFKPKKAGTGSFSRGGSAAEKSQPREPLTGASVGGNFRMKPKNGADGPDGSGNGTTHAAAQRPPKDTGGSSGPTRPRSKANGRTIGV